jgi:DNA polymerase-1
MKYLLFDLETNGLLPGLTCIHSIVLKDLDTGLGVSCQDASPNYRPSVGYQPASLKLGLGILADRQYTPVGHNVIRFDVAALLKLYPNMDIDGFRVIDTLVLSRLIWPDLVDTDAKLVRQGKLPPKLRGSHSLKAWGFRLGVYKGDFGDTTDWSYWTAEMQSYCEQDVEVTHALWKAIQRKCVAPRAQNLEMAFAAILQKQEEHGYLFAEDKAAELYQKLAAERIRMDGELETLFSPWFINKGRFTPKVNNSKQGYTKEVEFTKVQRQLFNPSSRQQIADRLIKIYGWSPRTFTPSGQPQIDETILSKLPYPPAKMLAKRFMLEKRIAQIAEGNQGWLKLVRNGRIHGSVNTIGAVTGRCTHSHPNMAQVPAVKKAKVNGETVVLRGEEGGWGVDCRELFCVPDGFKQVGADASGLELRCLAHFMAKYDGGQYARLLLEDDIHTVNQKAAGLPTRDNAKTFIYAYLYGAGDAKIGEIIGKGAASGKRLKEDFLRKTPALAYLKADVISAVKKRGYLYGIDGRKLHIRSEHAALNTLLQSAGALLVKQATINLHDKLTSLGYEFGREWALVAHIHDEVQLEVRADLAEEVAQHAIEAFRKAGRDFEWRCPLDGEAKIGNNWAECH